MTESTLFSTTLTGKKIFRLVTGIFILSVATGLLVAFFLWLLDVVTALRWQHLWLLFLLPVAGVLITWLYSRYGKKTEGGNKIIIQAIQQPGREVPAQMAPLILFTTVLTHLFGGSAGREGTAVQMGGSVASQVARWLKLPESHTKILLICGIAAGFAAVFGTPAAAVIFALEIIYSKRKYIALAPCIVAALVAHITCLSCGIHHTKYIIGLNNTGYLFLKIFPVDFLLLMKVATAGVLFGVAALVFVRSSHFIKNKSSQLIKIKWLIPIVGGTLITGISYLLGTFDYLGLGVTNPNAGGVSIVAAFTKGGTGNFSWLWKLLLTAITLGMGFKGGEVTPLFFIGATLGNVLAAISGAPIDLLAGLGFIAVFAGATKTPLACIAMGAELFGPQYIIYYAVACYAAYYCSGKTGIYQGGKMNVAVADKSIL
jgi:H+/Cl- antiporter ClcA